MEMFTNFKDEIFNKIEKYRMKKFKLALENYINDLLKNSDDFIIFKDDNEIESWGNDNYYEWSQQIKKNEITCDIFEYYAGYSYDYLNRYLRGYNHVQLNMPNTDEYQNRWREKAKKQSLQMNKALQMAKLNDNLIVFRCLSYEGLNMLINTKKIKPGTNFVENGFMSSSLRYKYAQESRHDVVLVIKVPKGSDGAYIDHISHRGFEAEFLFCYGQELKISKVIYNKNKKYILLCDLIIKGRI